MPKISKQAGCQRHLSTILAPAPAWLCFPLIMCGGLVPCVWLLAELCSGKAGSMVLA